jgi:hypothetical protein
MSNQMLDWKTLNQDNYWKQNWPSYHPTLTGLKNNDDVTFSSLRTLSSYSSILKKHLT